MARVEVTKRYIADDGKSFDTKEACEAYELGDQLKPLKGMSLETIQSIMRGEDETRANLMRRVLSAIAKPEGSPRKAPKRPPEQVAADLEARLAKIRAKQANGSGEATSGF